MLARLIPCGLLLLGAALLTTPTTRGWQLLGHNLSLGQRDFRVHENFLDPTANDNQVEHPNFPGATGATLAIWKGCVEWCSGPHGDGDGDPTQPGDLGSGQGNFDCSYQGRTGSPGALNSNVHSALHATDTGTLAFTEYSSSGWRIRYYENWEWEDGPDTPTGGRYDLQSVACHEYGHALGLDHSSLFGATMFAVTSGNSSSGRSITTDDRQGLQAIYGAADANKPIISNVSLANGVVTIEGEHFDNTDTVWFTGYSFTGDGDPVTAAATSSNGTTIVVALPSGATRGDVLVKRNTVGGKALSNPWPLQVPCAPPTPYCSTSPNSVGPGAHIAATTSQSVVANDLLLTATGLPPGQFGIFFYGPSTASVPVANGTLCVNTPFWRLGIVQSDASGAVSDAPDLSSPPDPAGQVLPGATLHYQLWYRDPGFGTGSNFSDAVTVSFCN